MKIKCINNKNKWGNFNITVGKYYEVIDVIETEPYALIKIINDENIEWRYFEKYFVSRKVMLRKEKLKKLNESIFSK
jgi:hypothetical protein